MERIRRLMSMYGLRIRVITMITGLTVFLVFLIGIVVLKIAEHNFMKQRLRFGDIAVHSLQSLLDTAWTNKFTLIERPEDIEALNRLVVVTAQNLRLIQLLVIDPGMRVIASFDADRLGQVIMDADVRKAFSDGSIRRQYLGKRETFGFDLYDEIVFTGPLLLNDDIVAVVRFSLPLDDISNSIAGTLTMIYLYTFLDVLLVLIVGGFILMYYFIRPMHDLRRVTEGIIQGDLGHPVPEQSSDEMGKLADALETLRCTLEKKEETSRKQMDSLASLNRQLTRIRDQLIHTDRLTYLGRVTAGVAHEIGNPLGSIYGYLDILRTSDDPKVTADVLERMNSEIGRIDSIMKELLNFSRPQHEERGPVFLPELIVQCVEILKTQRVLDQVEVNLQGSPSTPPVYGEGGQLKQVFMNLMVNAADAMNGKGTIEVSVVHGLYDNQLAYAPFLGFEPELETGQTAYTDMDKRGIFFSSRIPYTEGEKIVLVNVRDYGHGIESKNLGAVLDPFFTTKEKTKGTGLGLSICQRIVEGMGGLLRVQSRPGAGTVITCFFMPEKDQIEDLEDAP